MVEFYFKKTEGTLRQAFGTLMRSRVPETKGVMKKTTGNQSIVSRSVYPERDLNPHSCNSQRILSPSCLPFHHPGSLACIEDRKVPQSYVFLRNSAIISILFAFVVFLGIPCPRLARQGRTLLRISHTQTSQRVSQLRSLFAFSTLLVSRLPLNPQLSTLNSQP